MPLTPGTRLGPYVVSAPIGSGGMGDVYKATDTRLDRTVAIKVLPEHVAADPELRQRFEREAKILAALSHPHICPVYDVGSQVPSAPSGHAGSGPAVDFLVMEYLEGETLAQRLSEVGRVSRSGPTGELPHVGRVSRSRPAGLPIDQALQVAIQIADALDKAHRKGIVHRDLKPGNIMLTKSGSKLLDFGLAKLVGPPQGGHYVRDDRGVARDGLREDVAPGASGNRRPASDFSSTCRWATARRLSPCCWNGRRRSGDKAVATSGGNPARALPIAGGPEPMPG